MASGSRRTPTPVNHREEDYEKLDKLAAAISGKSTAHSKAPVQPYTIEKTAKDVLLDHLLEVVCSTVESAGMLARHKGAQSVSVSDVQLVLAKKHGAEALGGKRGNLYIHKNTCATTIAGGLEITSKTKGLKRKFKQDDSK